MLVKNQKEQRRVHKGRGECWQWKASRQCSKGDRCSFRHDGNKRAKPTPPPTPPPDHSTPQDVQHPTRATSPRGSSPSGKISRQPCEEHLKGTFVPIHLMKSGNLQNACSTCHKRDANSGKSVLMHTVQLKNLRAKSQ